ncbi:P-loop ATPase, Sll1717 family [Geothrix fuzhouensis]|uniref:P-loop ATPase, Sll1717 family n=1 Tax=Geothrix fuzhouensis TaxID=2966451 RepID=UPI002148FF45|nr:hypothetical protein [Geothrix fuzhouensis]
MEKLTVLRRLTFGSRIAEEETDALSQYFVETDAWAQVFGGAIDVVYGPKGSGKSALYSLLIAKREPLFDRGILLVAGENPRGATAFKGITVDPPLTELEFTSLWKLYICCLLHAVLNEYDITNQPATELGRILASTGLVKGSGSLAQLLAKVSAYVKRVIRPESVEGIVKFDPNTQLPVGVGAKINFSPDSQGDASGSTSVDRLLELANEAFTENGFTVWVLLDRLDVAFAEHEDLEANALRALFRVYLDLMAHPQIKLKIFLRSDIWSRITESGFREASHITRTLTIEWNQSSLLNLVVRRAVYNNDLRDFYSVAITLPTAPLVEQEAFFYRLSPAQVEVGPNKSPTFGWVISRTTDGLKVVAPREVIHFFNRLREVQSQRLEVGGAQPEAEALFERGSYKEALPEVSKIRLEQTLYAEYPNLKQWLEKLRGARTKQSVATLSSIWGVSSEEANSIAGNLARIGFFEVRGDRTEQVFWVPFLYRDGLDMRQGTEDLD